MKTGTLIKLTYILIGMVAVAIAGELLVLGFVLGSNIITCNSHTRIDCMYTK